jgi:acetyl esterase/lipase
MDPDIAYANAAFIPDADSYPTRWARDAGAFRALMVARGQARLNLPYGVAERQRYDLFLPDAPPKGLVLFVHGGYWRAFGREDWSHLAAGPVARGFAVAMPSYTLAPAARISAITQEIKASLIAASAEVAGPVLLTGHSAGGHLVARMGCESIGLDEEITNRIRHIAPISPLADLRPLLHTQINSDLHLTPSEAASESPLLLKPRKDTRVTVWVGAEERPAFLDQARWLAEAWVGAALHIAPGRHHFDVIDGLGEAASALTNRVIGDK